MNKDTKIYNAGHRGLGGCAIVRELQHFLDGEPMQISSTAGTVEKQLLPLPAVDVPDTYTDTVDLFNQFRYQRTSTLGERIKNFVAWSRNEFKAI